MMIWTLCLERLQDEMPANLFGMWIRPLQVEEGDTYLRLLAPNPFFRKHIAEKYLDEFVCWRLILVRGGLIKYLWKWVQNLYELEESARRITPSPPPPKEV
jgi:hypothetical protein